MRLKGLIMDISEHTVTVLTKDNEFYKLKRRPTMYKSQEVEFKKSDIINLTYYMKRFSMVAACFILILSGLMFSGIVPFWSVNSSEVFGYVSLDVNPGIGFEVDEGQKILRLSYLEGLPDNFGEELALEGMEISEGLFSIIEYYKKTGILRDGEENYVLLAGAVNDKNKTARKDMDGAESKIMDSLKSYRNTIREEFPNINMLVIESNAEQMKLSEKNHISMGKYTIFTEINQGEGGISIEEFKKLSLKDIIEEYMKLAKNNPDSDEEAKTTPDVTAVPEDTPTPKSGDSTEEDVTTPDESREEVTSTPEVTDESTDETTSEATPETTPGTTPGDVPAATMPETTMPAVIPPSTETPAATPDSTSKPQNTPTTTPTVTPTRTPTVKPSETPEPDETQKPRPTPSITPTTTPTTTPTSTPVPRETQRPMPTSSSTPIIRPSATPTPGETQDPRQTPDTKPTTTPGDQEPEDVGTGLRGEYYNNPDFTDLAGTRIDPEINFNWGRNLPHPDLNDDGSLSIRWEGQIKVENTEMYTFYINKGYGVRLWVNNIMVINEWTKDIWGMSSFGHIFLIGGQKYNIKLEYYDFNNFRNYGNMKLEWSSPSISREVVPQRVLFPSEKTLSMPKELQGDGNGLRGEYYNGMNFMDFKATVVDPEINFNWGIYPPHESIYNNGVYSIRWTGKVQPPDSGEYTFYVTHSSGAKLWVDGKLIIDEWNAMWEVTSTGKIYLEAGKKYDICLEYNKNMGNGTIRLEWERPGMARTVIPQSQLYSE